MQTGNSYDNDEYCCEEGMDGLEDDEDRMIFSSFDKLKKSVLRALYGTEVADLKDRSPKGSIDEPIRELVDLLNSHPNYATLSSCSGRIALFDPTAKTPYNIANTPPDDATQSDSAAAVNSNDTVISDTVKKKTVTPSTNSGKGGGSWLISSHAPITFEILEQALQNDNNDKSDGAGDGDHHEDVGGVLMFKHEPLLLHVAAGSLFHGRLLLSLALQLGFRESGMTMSGSSFHNKKLTVAIRTQSLSLCVPLGKQGHNLSLSNHPTYLRALVHQANQRFSQNSKKLLQLQHEVQTTLFLPSHIIANSNNHHKHKNNLLPTNPTPKTNDQKPKLSVEISDIKPLPPLNIWGHASVSIPKDNHHVNILVIGGYGTGPSDGIGDQNNNHKQVGAKRLDTTYQITATLRNHQRQNEIGYNWKLIKQSINQANDKSQRGVFPVNWKPTLFTAREGHAACILHLDNQSLPRRSSSMSSQLPNRWIAIFGGRTSPARPLSQLLLSPIQTSNNIFDDQTITFLEPSDIRGSPPSARWGHTMTSLSNENHKKNNHLAIVIGGRDATKEISTVHILSLVQTKFDETKSSTDDNYYLLQWEALDDTISIPRFHHISTITTSNNCNSILVMGGMQMEQGLLPSKTSFMSELNLQLSKTTPTTATISSHRNNDYEDLSSSFGSAVSSFSSLSFNYNDNNQIKDIHSNNILILCGGINNNNSSNKRSDNDGLKFFTFGDNDKREEIVMLPIIPHKEKRFNLGSLVHHSMECVPMCSNDEGYYRCDLFLLGGGVDSFAFGPLFARSYCISLTFYNGSNIMTNHLTGISSEKKYDGKVKQNLHVTLETKESNPTDSNKISTSQNQQKRRRPVLFVHKQNAKTLKQELEIYSFVDKSYRMIPTLYNGQQYIAIPVTNECIQNVNSAIINYSNGGSPDEAEISWKSLVIDTGILEVPFSTKVMGQQRKRL